MWEAITDMINGSIGGILELWERYWWLILGGGLIGITWLVSRSKF